MIFFGLCWKIKRCDFILSPILLLLVSCLSPNPVENSPWLQRSPFLPQAFKDGSAWIEAEVKKLLTGHIYVSFKLEPA